MNSSPNIDGKKNHVFWNWASTYSCHPELYFEPHSLLELRQILAAARQKGKKVKVIGHGHSPSDLACTEGYMVSMKHFNKVISIDHNTKVVKAEGGILLYDLIEILDKNQLAMKILCSISDISLAGAVATGTHGSGINYGSMGTYVLEMDMLCADGTVITLSREKDEDLFLAGVLSLGALGIVLSLTVQCEAAYRLSAVQYECEFKDLCENFKVHTRASEHFRCLWFPHTEKCQLIHVGRTNKPVSNKGSWFWDRFVGFTLLQFFFWISSFVPALVPWINRAYFRLLYSQRKEVVDRYDHIFNFDCLFQQFVAEWAIPIDKTAVVLCELKAWIENNFYAAHFPIEVRFVRGDDMLLSPAYHCDSCFINIVMYRPYDKTIPRERYWTAFEEIVTRHGGRTHWAKDHKVMRAQFEKMYPRWTTFVEIRNKLDPTRMFTNNYLQRFF